MTKDDRITTIVSEIQYWKEHKLLPEKYCDYLLVLYTQGEGNDTEAIKEEKRYKLLSFVHVVLLLLLLPFSFIVIYSTQFHFVLQLSVLFLFIGYSIFIYFYFKRNDNVFFHIAIVISLVLILLTSIHIATSSIANNQIVNLIIFINFVAWLIIGKKKQLKYLVIISILALLFTVFYVIL